ncbi:GBP domain-containing protein/GBP_C domain-containing protein [Cephalotus follicularis]|uniref:GBP domain-containing protein/GBP_C domain-containing protein n=1 Tax=Cephalotus follicularis TaxID=3775 RepID=A0A1Q3D4T0_CEPFO|nr:GBP domain-containing protein/GBP_C domain-containing protein [Cephalotus follicularis]
MMKFFTRGRDSSDSSPESATNSPYPSASSSPVTGPARPIRLVYCDEKGKFRMDPEAVAALQLVKEPIGVVSVCGRARQGKSFILNQLLGRSSGFQVASTHRPCTKGLWLWSAPLKRTALDGTEYNLLLLDSEGIDAYDQTGTYSTQIFSLAVLLSSMFVYNQMGGIDEAALDRLSLVTQMTKHIRVRASGGRTSASEIGQFSPIFVWLLRDFYLDLVEENRKITPRDYLELALRPVQGSGRDIAAKNEIRDSIRALFPDRECFTLVRPLNNENDLQRLDQISMDKLRPEFRSGLDALTKFVFERTRPKQVGATIMTGPVLVGITQSYLDALNNGAVPTISSSWQSVEETECRRAYDSATETYMSFFNRTQPPEEVAMREAHEEAVQKSLAIYNSTAVGAGSARKKFESLLQKFFRKAFEDYRKNAYMEADLHCSNAIQSMEKRLRAACHASDANIDSVVKVLDVLVSEYEASCHGPGKWQKLVVFFQQSLEGPILDLIVRLFDQIGSEKSSLVLKCRSIEDKMKLLNKQLEDSEKYKSEYLKRYDDAINDKKKLADDYMSRITNLQGDNSSLKERCSGLLKTLESTKQESLDWKRKYDQVLSRQKAGEDQTNSEIAVLKSRSNAAEARLAAAREQAKSAQEEAEEWKRKYDYAVREAKGALEKAAIVQERITKETQMREDALRDEFSSSLVDKEEEIKEKVAKIEYAEQCLTTLRLELKAAESKVMSYDMEVSSLKLEMKELTENLETIKAKAQSFEREARILEQEKIHMEQKYETEFKRIEELQERCKYAEREAKRATELADKAQAEAATAQKENSRIQKLAMERLAQIERSERQIENLDREKADLTEEIHRIRVSEMNALSKVALLEGRVEEREKEIESLLKTNNEQRASTVKALQDLLESERAAHADANNRAEALSHQLQSAQTKLDKLQQELTSVRLNETALDSKLKAVSHGKRVRADNDEMGVGSVQDMDTSDKILRANKRTRSTSSPSMHTLPEDGGSVFKGDEDNQSQQASQEDYTKFTVLKLKQELVKHGFGAEVLQVRNSNKKELLALYETRVLKKS